MAWFENFLSENIFSNRNRPKVHHFLKHFHPEISALLPETLHSKHRQIIRRFSTTVSHQRKKPRMVVLGFGGLNLLFILERRARVANRDRRAWSQVLVKLQEFTYHVISHGTSRECNA
jgi:hypothetical protein